MEFTPLTPEQRQQFNEQGYLIVRNALKQETVERLREAGDRLCATGRTDDRMSKNGGQYDGFRNCITKDDAYIELLQNPTTVPLVVQLFGPRLQFMTSHLIHKLPNAPGTLPTFRNPTWHRDLMYSSDDLSHAIVPRLEMKIAYYLTDLTEPNSGVTLFAPGSNHWKHNIQIPEGKVDPEGAVEPLVKAGDAVFFENRTFHAGSANLQSQTAKMVMFGYGFSWLKPMDYLVAPPELLEKVDDIGKQMLGGLKDPEGRFVPGGIQTPLVEWAKQHGIEYQPFH